MLRLHAREKALSAMHKALPPDAHTWRNQESLKSLQQFELAQELLGKKRGASNETRLKGLAAMLLGMYHGWGYCGMPRELLVDAHEAKEQLLKGARVEVKGGRPSVGTRMQAVGPGQYALTRAIEIVSGILVLTPDAMPSKAVLQTYIEDHMRIAQAFLAKIHGTELFMQSPAVTFGEVTDFQLKENRGVRLLQVSTVVRWGIMLLCKSAPSHGIGPLLARAKAMFVDGAEQLLLLQPGAPMALFFLAEALETRDGRTPQAQAAMMKAVDAAAQWGDEVYGCLAAWNAITHMVCGGSPYKRADVQALMAKADSWKQQLKRSGMWDSIQPRIEALSKPVLKMYKAAVAQAGASADNGLLMPAGCTQPSLPVYPGESPAHECANCHKLFHRTQMCSRCKAVRYCGEACQRGHWKQHKPNCQPAASNRAAGSSSSSGGAQPTAQQSSTQPAAASHGIRASGGAGGSYAAGVQPATADGPAALDADSAARMSVKELKAANAARGLDPTGCAEKSDLVALLLGS